MEYNEKKWWQIIDRAGALTSTVCCVISVFQYLVIKKYDAFPPIRYDSLIINFFALACFIYLAFFPLHFRAYAVLFYVYGVGNLLDNGNILGFLCIFVCTVFLFITDFFKSKKILKLILLYIAPIIAMCISGYNSGTINFLITIMHILGAIYMTGLVALVFYPRFREIEAHRTIKYINPSDCTPQELIWLQQVLNGTKYNAIALESHVSESKVKARMLELYKVLGVHDKTEFLTMYHNCEFDFSINVPKTTN